MDSDNFQSIINRKCPSCFRKDECMLLSDKHAGLELCLGPFRDQEDRLRKIREDREKEAKPKADIESLVKKSKVVEYWLNRALFESKSGRTGENEDDKPDE